MTSGDSPSERVLLVVADLDRRLAMHAFLETAGYDVKVSTVEQASSAVTHAAPALVIADAADDAVSVSDMLRTMREQQLPAVLCVVHARETDMQEQARVFGVDDCSSWPLSRAEFLWRVRSLLRWKREAAADSGALSRIQIDELLQLGRQREQTLALLIHDMKNPLSGVISNVEYLRTAVGEVPNLDPEVPGCAMDILQGSKRLYRMVQSLLDVNQSEHGLLAVDLQRIAVRDLLEVAHSTCRARLRDKAIKLVLICPEQRLELDADHDMLVRLLANLLDNAITATPNGGSIELRATENNGNVELRVIDQGPSLPPADRARLQNAESAMPLRNTRVRRGLGLRACRVLVEAHGGRISLEEHAPRGATVCVQLPRPA
ncbi:MAG TPA: ATP-binding protein [Polyangiales bacterium]|nr:ATP-binding protein [Polyangiales bacterium]